MTVGKCVRFQVAGMRAWDRPQMRESHAKCIWLDSSVASGVKCCPEKIYPYHVITGIRHFRLQQNRWLQIQNHGMMFVKCILCLG